MAAVLILLPPSEGKTAPAHGDVLDLASLCLPVLTPAREAVLDALVTLCTDAPRQALAVLAVPKTRPELVALNADLRSAPTAKACEVYTGVLYDALAAGTLSPAATQRLSQVLVASALFGLVGMEDPIPAYRLSGNTTLPGLPGTGGIQAHWRAHLAPAVTDALDDGLLVDLRSGTYAAFWRPASLPDVAVRTATLRVLHEADGVRTVVSHFNKATKGRIVRALLESGATPRTPAGLAETLRDLGWHAELGAATPQGTRLDVIVAAL